MVEESVDSSGAEAARAARQLLQIPAVASELRHSNLSDLAAGADLEPSQVLAPE